MSFAETFKRFRHESGLSLDVLSERLETSPGYLYQLEKGTVLRPDRNFTIRLGISLGLNLDGIDALLESARHVTLSKPRRTKQV